MPKIQIEYTHRVYTSNLRINQALPLNRQGFFFVLLSEYGRGVCVSSREKARLAHIKYGRGVCIELGKGPPRTYKVWSQGMYRVGKWLASYIQHGVAVYVRVREAGSSHPIIGVTAYVGTREAGSSHPRNGVAVYVGTPETGSSYPRNGVAVYVRAREFGLPHPAAEISMCAGLHICLRSSAIG